MWFYARLPPGSASRSWRMYSERRIVIVVSGGLESVGCAPRQTGFGRGVVLCCQEVRPILTALDSASCYRRHWGSEGTWRMRDYRIHGMAGAARAWWILSCVLARGLSLATHHGVHVRRSASWQRLW